MLELGLLIFSISIQAAVGIMLFLSIRKLSDKNSVKKIPVIIAAIFIIIGLIAFLVHLGQPIRLLKAFKNIRSSWLSREILLYAILALVIIVDAVVILIKPYERFAQNILDWLAVVIGIVAVAVLGNVHTFASVPSWYGAETFIDFYTTVILLGGILYYISDYKEQTSNSQKLIGVALLLSLIVQILSAVPYSANLSTLGAAGLASAKLLSAKSVLVILKYMFEIVGVTFFWWKQYKEKVEKGPISIRFGNGLTFLAAAFIIISTIIGRYLFYTIFVINAIGRN